jgi:AcrR family transcriptional regulator
VSSRSSSASAVPAAPAPIPPTASIRPTAKGAARRAAFLDAAAEVFVAQGFEAASMTEIVGLAGGSLATLYAQFGNKEGLFVAMMADRIEAFAAPIDAVASAHLPLAQGLRQIAAAYLDAILEPGAGDLLRMIIAEGRKFPAIARSFLSLGPERVRAALAAYLAERAAAGEAQITDPAAMASAFLDMVGATPRMRAVMDPDFAMTPPERAVHVDRCVRLFLAGAGS